MSRPISRVSRVLMAGPLAPFVDQYGVRLKERRYTRLSVVNLERQVARMSRWLEAEGLGVGQLSEARIEAFVSLQRVGGGGRSSLSRPGLFCLLELLRELGVVQEAALATPSPMGALMDSFGGYLLSERGLSAGTVRGYVAHATRFVAGLAPEGLGQVTAAEVTTAVLGQSATVSVSATQNFVAGLRAFLRFCFVEGLVEVDLSQAALPVTGRRRSDQRRTHHQPSYPEERSCHGAIRSDPVRVRTMAGGAPSFFTLAGLWITRSNANGARYGCGRNLIRSIRDSYHR